ncbi:hypothetical protein NPIL_104411, partial [Nephila pilipes]
MRDDHLGFSLQVRLTNLHFFIPTLSNSSSEVILDYVENNSVKIGGTGKIVSRVTDGREYHRGHALRTDGFLGVQRDPKFLVAKTRDLKAL